MRLSDYEDFTNSVSIYPECGEGTTIALAYTALGLVGEAGEYSEKVKKWIRDGVLDRELAAKELGDVLFYLTRSAKELGYSLEDILRINMMKLQSRKIRGVLQGSGDVR